MATENCDFFWFFLKTKFEINEVQKSNYRLELLHPDFLDFLKKLYSHIYSFLYHDAIAILPKSQHGQQMQGSNKDKYPNFPFVLKWLILDYLISRSIKYLIMLVERKSVPIVWIKKKNLLHLFIQFSAKYFGLW